MIYVTARKAVNFIGLRWSFRGQGSRVRGIDETHLSQPGAALSGWLSVLRRAVSIQQVLTEDTGLEPAFPKAVSVHVFALEVQEQLETHGDGVSPC